MSSSTSDLELTSPVGYDAAAYRQRDNYSPEPIRDALWNLFGNRVNGTVLDAGSGSGGWIQRLRQQPAINKIISVDIADSGAGQIQEIDFHICDLSTSPLPCADQSLDWIFALEVIEHLANPRHFIQEAKRTLKQNGKLIVTTPNNDSIRARISLLLRGYFPAFCEHDYQVSGHITPVLEVDLRRMAAEAKFAEINFLHVLPGQIPGTPIQWQALIPHLKGKLWSDNLFAVLTA